MTDKMATPKHSSPAVKCSLAPQDVNEGIWYYEDPGSIRLVINRKWFEANTDGNGVIVKVSRRKLESSLKRMNASRRKR